MESDVSQEDRLNEIQNKDLCFVPMTKRLCFTKNNPFMRCVFYEMVKIWES
jgi:hypothetical protein